LSVLAEHYLSYHLQLYSGTRVYAFFQQETERYRKELEAAREAQIRFGDAGRISLLPEQKGVNLERLAESQGALYSVIAALAEEETKVEKLSIELASLPPRVVTQQRTAPSQYSADRLNTMLQELRNRRTSLLTQFRPDDRRVTEVDRQIAQTQAAAEVAESQHQTEETTDLNPVGMTLQSDLAKARITAAALRSREQAVIKETSVYQRQLGTLNDATADYDRLSMAVKQAADIYDLYARKAEEARIADALDSDKIANVTVAEAPSLPAQADSRFGIASLSALLLGNAIILGVFTAFGVRHTSLYTPHEVETFTGFPIVATIAYEHGRRRTVLTTHNFAGGAGIADRDLCP
jgi:uncharacterized protein involved in exopolysaccharide biosynthesis